MRKIILLFFAILINIKSPAQFFFNPQAGLNIATLSGIELFVTSTTGVHAGLYLNIPLFDHFAVMPAVIYSTKEFKYDYATSTTASQPDISGNTIASTKNLASSVYATLGYIDIPVFLTYWTSKQDGFFIQAGPQLSLLISDIALIGSLGYKFSFLP